MIGLRGVNMKKIMILFGIIILFLSMIGGCQYQTSANIGINAQDSTFARMSEGQILPIEDPVFNAGEEIYYIFFNVGPFKLGEDGKHYVDIDMKIDDPEGNEILLKEEMLGESGHTTLPNGYAETPYGVYETTPNMPPGRYKMTISVYDKIGGGIITKVGTFEIQ